MEEVEGDCDVMLATTHASHYFEQKSMAEIRVLGLSVRLDC